MKQFVPGYLFLATLLLSVFNTFGQELPDDFPQMNTIKTGETGKGYVFLTVSTHVDSIGYYVFMIDDEGEPFKYRKLEGDYSYDFKVQPNGLLSYAQFLSHHSYTGGGNCIHMILDEDMNPVDSFQLQHGYIAEAHDFQLLPNGHALAFGYYLTQMDLSVLVDGGYPNALVSGGVIQELDQDKNVVWQWRSWEHFDPETTDFGRRSKNPIVSKHHLNTINLDYDDNILLATPSWTKKIDRITGEILWHLGGDQNEFSFIGVDSTEGVRDVTGHAFYLLENGNYLNYDNGPRRGSGTSEAHEFKLDQVNKTAEKVRTFTPDTDIAAWHRGNAQRLPNGNTLVGWGGASGDHIPTCTEFDSAGNTVLEVYFADPVSESYRAVRFPYPPVPVYEAWVEEVSPGGSYEMMQGDTLDTGVDIKLTELISVGYNELGIKIYNYAPQFPRFEGRAPMVLTKRIVVDQYLINDFAGEISFNAGMFGISNPDTITIFYRKEEGQGTFRALPTTHNPVRNEIKAEFDDAGEFIFTYPDKRPGIFAASPVTPANGDSISYRYPVKLEWSPKGFFNSFVLQVALDSEFTEIVTEVSDTRSTVYEMDNLEVNLDYYWRVKTMNESGESEWSQTAHFTTRAPYIEVFSPAGDEIWLRGQEFFIEWDDNIEEDVVLDLYHGQLKILNIDTVESRNAYKWGIPLDLDSTCNYHIRISSSMDSSVYDVGEKTFSLNDTSCTATPVPIIKLSSPNGGESLRREETVVIEWENNTAEAVSVELYKAGEFINTLASAVSDDTIHWTVPPAMMPGTDYRIGIRTEGSMNIYDASNADFEILAATAIHNAGPGPSASRIAVYPNPASSTLMVEYYIEQGERLSIKLFDLRGREIETLLNESDQPGYHSLSHAVDALPEGTYIIRFRSDRMDESRLINLIKD